MSMEIGAIPLHASTEVDIKAPWSQVVMVVDEALEGDLRAVLAASRLSVSVSIPIYAMTLEKTFSYQTSETVLARRADHLVADAVFFIGQTVANAAQWYLWWLRQCTNGLVAGSIAPEAYIHCTAEKPVSEDFDKAFLSRPGANDFLQNTIDQAIFRSLHVCADLDPFSPRDIEKVVGKSSNIRKAFNLAWSSDQALRVKMAYIGHFVTGKSTAFRVKPAAQWSRFLESTPRPYVDALLLSNAHRMSQPAFGQVLSSYIGNDEGVLTVSAHRNQDPNHSRVQTRFATECAEQQLRDRLKTLLAPFQESRSSGQRSIVPAVIRKLMSWSREADGTPAMKRRTMRERHLDTLGKNSGFLRSQEYGPLCFFCFARPWTRLLKCNKHGVCDECWPPVRERLAQRCMICDTKVTAPTRRIHREEERGRILALDGGGVKGLIQLEVLAMLEEEIGLDLPLRRFFDLIVGTSIGESCDYQPSSH